LLNPAVDYLDPQRHHGLDYFDSKLIFSSKEKLITTNEVLYSTGSLSWPLISMKTIAFPNKYSDTES